jgi:hypothetical protein
MTARTALLYLLRTHDGAADGDPQRVLGTAGTRLRANDDVEVRGAARSSASAVPRMPGA